MNTQCETSISQSCERSFVKFELMQKQGFGIHTGWLLLVMLWLVSPLAVRAQFIFITNNGAITITGFMGWSGGDLTIPASTNGYPVTSIGDIAFVGNDLTNITIPNSITNIGTAAFSFNSGLTNVMIPDSVTSIGGGAFSSCDNLIAIRVGAQNPNYSSFKGTLFDKNQNTLLECPGGIVGSFAIPPTVTSIGGGAFGKCWTLTQVIIPRSVSSIGDFAFYEAGLTSVTIPDSVTNIGQAAFAITSLTNAIISNRLTSIGDHAFYYCTSLNGVYFSGNAPIPATNVSVFSSANNVIVYYLPGTSGWSANFDGRPTALWTLPYPLILYQGPGFGPQPNGFGFTISWATNIPVVIETATNLGNPVWLPLATNTLSSGTNSFSDPDWTNYPNRFYRVRSP